MVFITFVRLLPARIVAAISAIADTIAEAHTLQNNLARKYPIGFDS